MSSGGEEYILSRSVSDEGKQQLPQTQRSSSQPTQYVVLSDELIGKLVDYGVEVKYVTIDGVKTLAKPEFEALLSRYNIKYEETPQGLSVVVPEPKTQQVMQQPPAAVQQPTQYVAVSEDVSKFLRTYGVDVSPGKYSVDELVGKVRGSSVSAEVSDRGVTFRAPSVVEDSLESVSSKYLQERKAVVDEGLSRFLWTYGVDVKPGMYSPQELVEKVRGSSVSVDVSGDKITFNAPQAVEDSVEVVGKQIQESKESEVKEEAKQVDAVKPPVVDLDVRLPALMHGTTTQPADIFGKVFEDWFAGTPAGTIVNVLDMPTQAVLKGYGTRLEEYGSNPLIQSVLSLGAGLAVGITSLISPRQWVESVSALAKPQQMVEEVSKSPHTAVPFIVGSAVSSALVTGLATSKLAPKTTAVKEVEFVSPKLSELSLGIYDDVFYGKQVYRGTGWVRGTAQPEYMYVVKESPSGKVTYVQEPGKMLVVKTEGGGGKAGLVTYEVHQSLLDKLRGQVKVTEKTYYVHEGITPDDFLRYKQMIADTKQYHALKALGVEEVDVKTPKAAGEVDLTSVDFKRFVSGGSQTQVQKVVKQTPQTPKTEVKTVQVPVTESASVPVAQAVIPKSRLEELGGVSAKPAKVEYYTDVEVVSYPLSVSKQVTPMSSVSESAVIKAVVRDTSSESLVPAVKPVIADYTASKVTELVESEVRLDVIEVPMQRFERKYPTPAVDEEVHQFTPVVGKPEAVVEKHVQPVIREEVRDTSAVVSIPESDVSVRKRGGLEPIQKTESVPDWRKTPAVDGETIRTPFIWVPSGKPPSPPSERYTTVFKYPLLGGGTPFSEGKMFRLTKPWTFRQRINPWEYRLNVITRKFEKSIRRLGL